MKRSGGRLFAVAMLWIMGSACDAGSLTGGGASGGGGGPGDGSGADAAGITGPSVTIDFEPTDEDFVNPERGYYVSFDLLAGDSAASVRTKGHSLAIGIVRLDAYRDVPLDDALLDGLRAGFARVRSAGVKVVLRFAYNAGFDPDATR